MTLAVVGTQAATWGSASVSLTIPAGATGMVLAFQQGDDAGPQGIGGAETESVMKVGSSELLTSIAFDLSGAAVTSGGGIWWIADMRGRDSDVVTWTNDKGGGGTVGVIYFSASVPLLRDVNAYTDTGFGLSGADTRYQSSDASVPVTGGNQLAIIERFQSGTPGSNVISPGTEVFGNAANTLMGYDIGAADEAVSVGAYCSGQFWGWTLGITVYESVVLPIANPDPLDVRLALNAGVMALTGNMKLNGGPMRALTFGLRPGRLSGNAKRQVAFVAGDPHLKTPEMTVGGDEGDLLTQHEDRPPSWAAPDGHVHSRRWVPAVYRPDPVGAPDDWQLLHADDGSVVMTWVED